MERRANDKHLSSPFGLGAQIDSAGDWRGPPPSRGCSARRLVRGRDFNLVLEREHRTAPNNEQTRAELMAVSSVALGRPPLLRRPTTGPCAESPNWPPVIEGRIHGPVYRRCASPCNPGKRSAILVGEAPPAGRKSVCVCSWSLPWGSRGLFSLDTFSASLFFYLEKWHDLFCCYASQSILVGAAGALQDESWLGFFGTAACKIFRECCKRRTMVSGGGLQFHCSATMANFLRLRELIVKLFFSRLAHTRIY